jgi:hypothetical protein
MEAPSDFSPAAKYFLTALEALCQMYGIQLAVSGYDTLQLWNLDAGERPLCCRGIEDRIDEERLEHYLARHVLHREV